LSTRLEMIEKMIAAGSKEPFHHYARAMELRSLERKDEALAAFGDVRDRFPDYVPTYLMAAQLAQELDRMDDARRWAEDGIAQARAKGDDHALRELTTLHGML
jgi:hypothetical protein